MSQIFDEYSDSDIEIKTNNDYAKNYDVWRKKEELNKLKTKYGEDLLEQRSSSSSSEDDDEGVELTGEIEKQFFKTLSYLKNKDPRIYDENIQFFEKSVPKTEKTSKRKKNKALYISDYERELLLQKNGDLSDEGIQDPKMRSPTYVEEQNKLLDNFKEAFGNVSDVDDDGEWGGMLKLRQKTKEEKLQEEADYRKWLRGQKENIADEEDATELKPLKDYWSNPNLDNGEKFLRDYILKKKFLNKEDADYIPTYEEVVHDSDKDLSEDESAIERQEEFEHKYNFRFEEPDQEFIKRYPRTMEQSLRKTDDKRKVKRADIKQRKQKEKETKMQELKTLRELKRQEIEDKIEKLQEITGNSDITFKDEDLEGDFDPEAHDKRMEALFNDEFYEGAEEDQKPKFPELDEYLEIENWESWKGESQGNERDDEEKFAPHCEDEDFNMDCDYDPQLAAKNSEVESVRGRKKRKRKSLFAKVVNQQKPVFDPNEKTYEQYLDEYYKLDCEDFIGDIPCKFKYRKVVANSFGLTMEEILTANDRELNKWCSLKKAVQYRPDHVEKYDQIAYEKKSRNMELKKKILPSLFEENVKPPQLAQGNEKEMGKKRKKKGKKEIKTHVIVLNKAVDTAQETGQKSKASPEDTITKTNEDATVNRKNKKKDKRVVIGAINKNKSAKRRKFSREAIIGETNRKRKKAHNNTEQNVGISDARLSAYGINPKKFKNKLIYGKS